ncbi:MAG: NUDIX hydrolase [Eubacteriales bacterium]
MQGYNIIAVFNENADRILMCKRRNPPYKGLSNFIGGKIEKDENGADAAYRELREETAISKNDITLSHLMDFTYYYDNCYLEVYVGKLSRTVWVSGDENECYWSALDQDFFDVTQYAGDGNIGHIMMHIQKYRKELLR